jgi:uncharacterized protein
MVMKLIYSALAFLGLTLMSGCSSISERPTLKRVEIYTAGKGSAFLPYGEGLSAYLHSNGLEAEAIETSGSIENIQKLELEPNKLATVFLGTASEAVSGNAAWTNGKKYENLRALFPMYETSFQFAALTSNAIKSVSQISNKKVGVGPKGGPAESFFNGLAAELGLNVIVVNGTPTTLSAELMAGKIDVLWQGAVTPIPLYKRLSDEVDITVFGLSNAEQKAMLKRFPSLSAATLKPGAYRGQSGELITVSAWNFVLAHKDLSDADAYWVTRTVLSAKSPTLIHPSSSSTQVSDAKANAVLLFHPGALKFYREQGLAELR